MLDFAYIYTKSTNPKICFDTLSEFATAQAFLINIWCASRVLSTWADPMKTTCPDGQGKLQGHGKGYGQGQVKWYNYMELAYSLIFRVWATL